MKTLAQTNKEKSLPLSALVGNMYRDQGIAGFYRGVVRITRAATLHVAMVMYLYVMCLLTTKCAACLWNHWQQSNIQP